MRCKYPQSSKHSFSPILNTLLSISLAKAKQRNFAYGGKGYECQLPGDSGDP